MAIPKSNLLEYCDFTQCSTIQTRHYPPTKPARLHIPTPTTFHSVFNTTRRYFQKETYCTYKDKQQINSTGPRIPLPPSPTQSIKTRVSPTIQYNQQSQNTTARTGLVRGRYDTAHPQSYLPKFLSYTKTHKPYIRQQCECAWVMGCYAFPPLFDRNGPNPRGGERGGGERRKEGEDNLVVAGKCERLD